MLIFVPDPVLDTEGAAGTKKDKNSYSHGASILVISGDFFFFLKENQVSLENVKTEGDIRSVINNRQSWRR